MTGRGATRRLASPRTPHPLAFLRNSDRPDRPETCLRRLDCWDGGPGEYARNQRVASRARPERPELVAEFEAAIPGYGRRHEIPPGITGLAQTRSGYHTDPAYKLGHDLQYLMSWSPILDMQILARTVLVMVRRQS